MKKFLLLLLSFITFGLNSQNWENIGGGTDGLVQVFFNDTTSNLLYAGGNFVTAGTDTVNCIAFWDGNSWNGMAEGVSRSCDACACSSNVFAITKFQGKVYAAGNFTEDHNTPVIASWDGVKWDSIINIPSSSVLGFLPTDSILYVYGVFDSIGNIESSKIIKWDGINWSSIDNTNWGLHGIYTAQIFRDELYIGGNFENEDYSIRGFAKWDGDNWTNLGLTLNGTSSWVRDMEVF